MQNLLPTKKLLLDFRWEPGQRATEESTIASIVVFVSSKKVWKHLVHCGEQEGIVRLMSGSSELHTEQYRLNH